MIAGAKFASMHTEDSLVGPVESWHESCLPLGGPGCPGVAEFAVTEFAAALGKSPEAGRRFLARCVEGFYRLPDCWERLQAGRLEAWRLGTIADATMCLSRDAAEFVDTHVAPVAHRIGQGQLMRLVAEAQARFDPEQAEADRQAAADARHFDVELAQVVLRRDGARRGRPGPGRRVRPQHRGRAGAAELLRSGRTESLGVRRAHGAGGPGPRPARPRVHQTDPRRSDDADRASRPASRGRVPAGSWCCTPTSPPRPSPATPRTGAGPPTWPGSRRPSAAVTTEQIRSWCGNAEHHR